MYQFKNRLPSEYSINCHKVRYDVISRSYRDRTGKMRSFSEAVRPLVPLFIFFALSSLWAVFSPNDIINRAPRIFYILTGTIFSNINVSTYLLIKTLIVSPCPSVCLSDHSLTWLRLVPESCNLT